MPWSGQKTLRATARLIEVSPASRSKASTATTSATRAASVAIRAGVRRPSASAGASAAPSSRSSPAVATAVLGSFSPPQTTKTTAAMIRLTTRLVRNSVISLPGSFSRSTMPLTIDP